MQIFTAQGFGLGHAARSDQTTSLNRPSIVTSRRISAPHRLRAAELATDTVTEPLTLPTTIDAETQLETALLEPPLVEYLGINFMKNGSDFTRQALQDHGYVWKAEIFGNVLYGIGGAEGLRMFYNEEYVKRYPGMSQNLEDAAWKHEEGLAIPPLDSDRKWAWRKQHFMGTVSTRAAAEAYLAALDATFQEVLPKLGADGKDFSMWDTINELILGGLSKAFFGYGIEAYKDGSGQAEMINNIQMNYKVFDSPVFATLGEREAFASNIEYLRTALAEYRGNPSKYPDATLGAYLEGAEDLSDNDIIMDMHQMLCVGSYGGVTSAAICMAASLAYFPQARACVRTELKEKLQEPLTFASIRELPYTFAFMKETLRKWPIVHVVKGQTIKDMPVGNMLVPNGAAVIALLHGTMHDPTIFPDPDEFEPERFLPPRNEGSDEEWAGWQVVFGAGDSSKGHACAGKNIGITVLLALLIRLVQNWDWDLVDKNEELVTSHLSPTPAKGMMMRRKHQPLGFVKKLLSEL